MLCLKDLTVCAARSANIDCCWMFQWLPESARYHVASGQPDKALSTLRQVAADNSKPMLFGRLVVDDSIMQERGRVGDLLIPQLRRTSLLLWFIW